MANEREPRVPFLFMLTGGSCRMSTTELTERIHQLLDELFTTDDRLRDCFVVEISLHARNKLCVFVDSDSGINFDKCAIISRHLEGYIDAQGWLGEKYTLEVSSPGVGRPLRFWRQYRNNIGRHVLVTLQDKTTHRGLLKAVEEHQIVLAQEVTEKQGKKRQRIQAERHIPFDQIASTVVKVAP